jgi:hypothetical protein
VTLKPLGVLDDDSEFETIIVQADDLDFPECQIAVRIHKSILTAHIDQEKLTRVFKIEMNTSARRKSLQRAMDTQGHFGFAIGSYDQKIFDGDKRVKPDVVYWLITNLDGRYTVNYDKLYDIFAIDFGTDQSAAVLFKLFWL